MLLLNICCAPCALPIIEKQKELRLLFYSPNIFPLEEYQRRLAATRQIAAGYQLNLSEGDYDHDNWLAFIRQQLPKAPEEYAEDSARCLACFTYRLTKTAEAAKRQGCASFATTLSLSRHKDVGYINKLGNELAQQNGLSYVTFPLTPQGAHQRGVELSKQQGIYRQKYCGCEFSLPKLT